MAIELYNDYHNVFDCTSGSQSLVSGGNEKEVYISWDFALNPNPTEGEFVLQIEDKEDKVTEINISIFDVSGREILNKNIDKNGSQYSLMMNSEPPGVYVLKVKTNLGVKSKLLFIE